MPAQPVVPDHTAVSDEIPETTPAPNQPVVPKIQKDQSEELAKQPVVPSVPPVVPVVSETEPSVELVEPVAQTATEEETRVFNEKVKELCKKIKDQQDITSEEVNELLRCYKYGAMDNPTWTKVCNIVNAAFERGVSITADTINVFSTACSKDKKDDSLGLSVLLFILMTAIQRNIDGTFTKDKAIFLLSILPVVKNNTFYLRDHVLKNLKTYILKFMTFCLKTDNTNFIENNVDSVVTVLTDAINHKWLNYDQNSYDTVRSFYKKLKKVQPDFNSDVIENWLNECHNNILKANFDKKLNDFNHKKQDSDFDINEYINDLFEYCEYGVIDQSNSEKVFEVLSMAIKTQDVIISKSIMKKFMTACSKEDDSLYVYPMAVANVLAACINQDKFKLEQKAYIRKLMDSCYEDKSTGKFKDGYRTTVATVLIEIVQKDDIFKNDQEFKKELKIYIENFMKTYGNRNDGKNFDGMYCINGEVLAATITSSIVKDDNEFLGKLKGYIENFINDSKNGKQEICPLLMAVINSKDFCKNYVDALKGYIEKLIKDLEEDKFTCDYESLISYVLIEAMKNDVLKIHEKEWLQTYILKHMNICCRKIRGLGFPVSTCDLFKTACEFKVFDGKEELFQTCLLNYMNASKCKDDYWSFVHWVLEKAIESDAFNGKKQLLQTCISEYMKAYQDSSGNFVSIMPLAILNQSITKGVFDCNMGQLKDYIEKLLKVCYKNDGKFEAASLLSTAIVNGVFNIESEAETLKGYIGDCITAYYNNNTIKNDYENLISGKNTDYDFIKYKASFVVNLLVLAINNNLFDQSLSQKVNQIFEQIKQLFGKLKQLNELTDVEEQLNLSLDYIQSWLNACENQRDQNCNVL